MLWLLYAQIRWRHEHDHGSGDVWRGRFKAFPIQADEHFLTVLTSAKPANENGEPKLAAG